MTPDPKSEEKIIATSQEGDGLLPMKESKEKEPSKSNQQKAVETCNFIKNAFVVDGKVEMVLSPEKPVLEFTYFRCHDSKRGVFNVAINYPEVKR